MKAKSALIATIATVGIAGAAQADTSSVTTTFGGATNMPLVIPDGVIGGGQGAVVTSVITVPAGLGTIIDVDVNININHTWYGDVRLVLNHGANVVLAGQGAPDSSNDLAGIYNLNDEAATTWDAAPAVAGVITPGSYKPDSGAAGTLLSAYDGTDLAGAWTLSASDWFGFDTGSITSWELVITYKPVPAPGALALLGLAGVFGRGRRRRA